MSYQLIERAHRAGFEALIVTVDTIVPPNREYNTHNGFLLPFTPNLTFTLDIMRHPVWFTNVLMKYFTTIGMPRNENYPDEYKRSVAQRSQHAEADAAGFARTGTTSRSSATSGRAS